MTQRKGAEPTEKHDSEDTKMTEKTAQQIARMKEQTIGVEIEMKHRL